MKKVSEKKEKNKLRKTIRQLKNKKDSKKNKDLSYHIQIRSAKKRIPINSKELKNFKNIDEHFVDGLYKYSTGKASSFSEMKKLRESIIEFFPDAFITKYKNDSIVSRWN